MLDQYILYLYCPEDLFVVQDLECMVSIYIYIYIYIYMYVFIYVSVCVVLLLLLLLLLMRVSNKFQSFYCLMSEV